jgi:16S rRNA (cytidine1402-2'-O)-methyltransferase
MNTGRLFLIPTVIAEEAIATIPESTKASIGAIQHFLVEEPRTARRYLSSLRIYSSIEALTLEVLNKKTTPVQVAQLLKPLHEGFDVGVVSESGCPGVADPGAVAVAYAHANSIPVIPLVGPSSLLLALMASGMNGQRFAFHGYLPIDGKEAAKVIRELEVESKQKRQTQMFIETPYRNNSVFKFLLKNLHPSTWLHVSLDLTGKNQKTQTLRVAEWRRQSYEWPKTPAVFLFLADQE